MIISGGSNVYPREVEEVFVSPSGRVGGVCILVFRTRYGSERIIASVVLRSGLCVEGESANPMVSSEFGQL
jgi:acyl-CoA synthetase (AMP-forming)/AMP-acid ligase II